MILTLKLIDNGNHAADFGEATLTLLISFGPFFYLLAFGMALYAVVLIVEIYVLLIINTQITWTPLVRLHGHLFW